MKGKLLNKNKSGITLIALIITIIVLLILAGVSISMISGENGILSQASKAKANNIVGEEKEAIGLSYSDCKIYALGGAVTKEKIAESLTKMGHSVTVTEEEGKLKVTFNKTGHMYAIDENGKTCTVTIISNVKAITVEDIEIRPGQSKQLVITTTPSENVEELTYTSSDENIAAVDATGKVTVAEDATSGDTVTITVAGKVTTSVKGTCTVTVGKKIISLTAEQIAANPKDYYGEAVVNYKVSDSDTNVYRIFYVDTTDYFGDGDDDNDGVTEPIIYLKADYSSSESTALTRPNTLSTTSKIRQLNPMWNDDAGKLDSNYSSWNDNEQRISWLCDTEIELWKNACFNGDMAKYVVGGPSVEMYIKSYNVAFEGETDEYTFDTYYTSQGYKYKYKILGETEYTEGNNTPTNSLNYKDYNSMYAGENGTDRGHWWLASPSSYSSIAVCIANGNKAFLTIGANTSGVSPLICLKPGVTVEIEQ